MLIGRAYHVTYTGYNPVLIFGGHAFILGDSLMQATPVYMKKLINKYCVWDLLDITGWNLQFNATVQQLRMDSKR